MKPTAAEAEQQRLARWAETTGLPALRVVFAWLSTPRADRVQTEVELAALVLAALRDQAHDGKA